MKNGTLYAGRLKKAYAKLRRTAPKPVIPDPDDPLNRLATAILGVSHTEEAAAHAVKRALDAMVDWNEIRVSRAFELNHATGNTIPNGLQRCQRLIRMLQSVYDRENVLSLDHLKTAARREARHYLEQLNGVDEYAVASVILWSLGGHAIPVNDQLLKSLRAAELVHPTASRAEVQAFLERHISAAEAKSFCLVMRSFRAGSGTRSRSVKKKGSSKKKVTAKRAS